MAVISNIHNCKGHIQTKKQAEAKSLNQSQSNGKIDDDAVNISSF